MNYRCGLWCHPGKGVDMSNNVVPELLFEIGGPSKIDIIKMSGHLFYLTLLDRQAEFFLRLCQLKP